MSFRVVFLSSDNAQAQRVLEAVRARGLRLDAAVVLRRSFAPPFPRGGPRRRSLRMWPRAVGSALYRLLLYARRRRAAYRAICGEVVLAGPLNRPGMLRRLRRLEPDFIVLGGVGILSDETIRTARRGVINAHPALLPWVRGNFAVGHALAAGVAAGATVHYVDPGIDTGAIIERRLLRVTERDRHLPSLELRAMRLAAEMTADVVEALRRGEVPEGAAQQVRYPLFRWPDREGVDALNALATEGPAARLFRAWLPLCADPERLALPAGQVEAPAGVRLRAMG